MRDSEAPQPRLASRLRKLAKRCVAPFKPVQSRWQQQRNQGVFATRIDVRIGFFAQLNWCLYVLQHCDNRQLRPYLRLTSSLYTRPGDENWLDYFFDNLTLGEADRTKIETGAIAVSHVEHLRELGLPGRHVSEMTIDRAQDLLTRYLAVKAVIVDEVERYVAGRFRARPLLGIHYRGTDKTLEADRVSWRLCRATANRYLEVHPETRGVFIASDEAAFVEQAHRWFPGLDVMSRVDSYRSRDGQAVHLRAPDGDAYLRGKDALMNSLLLSRCTTLLRTASFLSGWSSIFSPGLRVILLNSPYPGRRWFPDREVMNLSMNQYLPAQYDSPAESREPIR